MDKYQYLSQLNMKNKLKKVLLVMLSIISMISLVACSSSTQSSQSSDSNAKENIRTITDAVGNKVEIKGEVKKIGVVPIPWASVIYSIDGSSERLAEINPSAMKAYEGSLLQILDPNFANISTKNIGSDFSINKEEILNEGVDSMLIWDYQTEEAEQLKKIGVAPIMLKNSNMDELTSSLTVVGELLNKEEKAQSFIDCYKDTYKYITSKSDEIKNKEKQKVLYLRSSDLKVQGNDNFMKEVLEICGAENVAADVDSTVTMEEVLKMDPDIIFLSDFDEFTPEDLYENKIDGQDWSNVSAVKNRRVYKTPLGVYRFDAPGVETPLMMLWMGKIISPDVFTEYEIDKSFKSYYEEYFNYKLTDKDLNSVLKDEQNSKIMKYDR